MESFERKLHRITGQRWLRADQIVDGLIPSSSNQSVLGQDTEPYIAPDDVPSVSQRCAMYRTSSEWEWIVVLSQEKLCINDAHLLT